MTAESKRLFLVFLHDNRFHSAFVHAHVYRSKHAMGCRREWRQPSQSARQAPLCADDTGQALTRMLDILRFEFNAAVVATAQRRADQSRSRTSERIKRSRLRECLNEWLRTLTAFSVGCTTLYSQGRTRTSGLGYDLQSE
jgi:hypothetical protein